MNCVTLQSGVFVVTVTKTLNLNFKTYLTAHRYTTQLLLRIRVGGSAKHNCCMIVIYWFDDDYMFRPCFAIFRS